jgi:serine/threonine-protein kinase HipA
LKKLSARSSMETGFEVAPRFGLRAAEARQVARVVASAVRTWRAVARKHGLKSREIERMESAFEHAELARAAK